MLNKEIEQLLSCDNCKLDECVQCEISYTDRKKIREYIEQLETELEEVTTQRNELATELSDNEDDKQKLIEKLEEDIENSTKGLDTNILLIKEYYKLEYAQEILKIVKGEKDEQSR